jgi:hypothetical protein
LKKRALPVCRVLEAPGGMPIVQDEAGVPWADIAHNPALIPVQRHEAPAVFRYLGAA